MRYTSDGTLVNKIGQFGDGPEEYSSIIDFSIDKSNSRILILTRESALYLYSTAGVFDRKVTLSEDFISKLSCNTRGVMTTSAYSSGMTDRNGFLLTEYDDEFHPIGKWIPFAQPKRPPFNPLGADFLATNGAYTYYFDDINHDIISYDGNSNDVNIIMSFDLSNSLKIY